MNLITVLGFVVHMSISAALYYVSNVYKHSASKLQCTPVIDDWAKLDEEVRKHPSGLYVILRGRIDSTNRKNFVCLRTVASVSFLAHG